MKQELQPYGEFLRTIPKGKPVLTITNLPYGGSITMAENDEGNWQITSRSSGGFTTNYATPPDAYGMLYPLFARIWNERLNQ